MKKYFQIDVLAVLALFILSRAIIWDQGIHFNFNELYYYWQYLDVETLRHNLMAGVWYDHAQPPGFNLLLGIILKLSGKNAPLVFDLFFKMVTLANVLLLLSILKKIVIHRFLPLLISLFYLLSPATMTLETEFFYTTLVSLLLLLTVYYLLHFQKLQNWLNAIFIFVPLVLLCYTRTMYHFIWLLVISSFILYFFKNKTGFRKLMVCASVSFILVLGLFSKNYFLFNKFSSTSWLGMNLSRNVFVGANITDSSQISAYWPFQNISVYKKFIPPGFEKKYLGWNDRDLIQEFKNGNIPNRNHVDYIILSEKYMQESKDFVKAHPTKYLHNVMESAMLFFFPATKYIGASGKALKIKYYDVFYSPNLTHFTLGINNKDISFAILALPKFLLYFIVFFLLVKWRKKIDYANPMNWFIIITIFYVFLISTVMEYTENMRFRYEIEPLFLILLAQVLDLFILKRNKTSMQL